MMFSGYVAAVVTPFKNGKVDFDSFEKYVSWISGSGISGIVVCGSTGESLSLTEQEQKELIITARNVIHNKVQLIGGVISSSTELSLKLMKNSEEYVDAFLCVCPFYIKPTQHQVIGHFNKLSNGSSKPIIIYNNPCRVGISIGKEAFDAIIKNKNIVAIKECACDLSRFSLWKQSLTRDFDFLTGNDCSAFGALAMGAKGVISVIANVCPEICVAGYKAFVNGDQIYSEYRDILEELASLMFAEPSPAPAKYALSRLGLIFDEVREPLTTISRELKVKIDKFLEKVKDVKV